MLDRLAAQHPHLAGDVQKFAETLNTTANFDGVLTVSSKDNVLSWYVDAFVGSGECVKDGEGVFRGSALSKDAVTPDPPRKFTLTIADKSATLKLFDKDGNNIHTFTGTGVQNGLDSPAGKAWSGTWYVCLPYD